MSRGFWTPLTEITSKWCCMFWRTTTKVFFFILNKEESLLTSLGRHYSFRKSATFLFLLSLFYGTIFFCRWRVVQCPRQQMYVDSCTMLPPMHNGDKPVWNSIFSFVICIRFDTWSGMFLQKFSKELMKGLIFIIKGFKFEFIKGLARLSTYHHRRRRRR